jgi:hypothetical protein
MRNLDLDIHNCIAFRNADYREQLGNIDSSDAIQRACLILQTLITFCAQFFFNSTVLI